MQAPCTFGRFAFDPESVALFDEGNPVRLGTVERTILTVLLERPGVLVPKAELMSRVWGHSVVGDNALHVHIARLRKTLGNDTIVTRRGAGYRFAAPLSREHKTSAVGNLPILASRGAGLSPLIGRDDDLQQVVDLLRTARLVSLTGPGGVGKTSLGLQASRQCADEFRDGAWLVELSALNDPKIAASQIAATLGLGLGKTHNPLQTLARLIRDKDMLLLLDNCEHLVEACGEICETLLSMAPRLKIVVTTRQALSCAGEMVFVVPPLAVPRETPTTAANVRKSGAFELFLERARGAASGFAINDNEVGIAARICRRIDGLPLAIEMVASWAAMFGLQALDERLDGSIESWPRARDTAPPRHSTLTATLEWSHGLLSAEEQIVLRRLSVFAGAFAMQAAEAVVSDEPIRMESLFDHVAALIRKSMVTVVAGTRPPMFRLLATTRALMAGKLAGAPEANAVLRRHATYVLKTVRRAIDELQTVPESVWLKRHASVLPDMRGALDWASREDPRLAITLAGDGWQIWRELSLHGEGRQRLDTITRLVDAETPRELKLGVQRALAELCLNSDAEKFAYRSLLEVVSSIRELKMGPEFASAFFELGFAASVLGRTEEAHGYVVEAIDLLQRSGRTRDLARAYATLSAIQVGAGRYADAKDSGLKALRLCEIVGSDRGVFVVAANLLEAAVLAGNLSEAIADGNDIVARLRSAPYPELLGYALGLMSCTLLFQRKPGDALPLLREASTILREAGLIFWLYDKFALRLALNGRQSDAAVVAGFAFAALEKSGRSGEPLAVQVREALYGELRGVTSDDVIKQLIESGKHLTEERALALALEY
ncbi:MAG TPA: winged helix-turn-helix domain-containing protein [Rhizomicrobium sp.]|nr:winged helix-turn-helix domain-containing protein [Rhizomicrobium sp.]